MLAPIRFRRFNKPHRLYFLFLPYKKLFLNRFQNVKQLNKEQSMHWSKTGQPWVRATSMLWPWFGYVTLDQCYNISLCHCLLNSQSKSCFETLTVINNLQLSTLYIVMSFTVSMLTSWPSILMSVEVQKGTSGWSSGYR